MGEKYYKYKLAKMKKYVLISFLFINISQTTCVNNAHKTNHVADVQQNNHDSVDESINLIVDEIYAADSVYSLCINTMEWLIKNPSEENLFKLEHKFIYADNSSELLLYYIVAANKLGLDFANIRIANCLTHSLSIPNVGKNSKKIALYYLNKGKFETQIKRGKQIIERFETSSENDIEQAVPVINYRNSEIQRLKSYSLRGSIKDYKKLKEIMYNDRIYPFMLYYSYIMADRYGYSSAKKDVVTIIKRFYREYNLGPIDKDTQYFCSFFE